MTPITLPPAASAASATTPMSPTCPPPYTRVRPEPASRRPRLSAAAAKAGAAPGLDPQKTQTLFTANRLRSGMRRDFHCQIQRQLPHPVVAGRTPHVFVHVAQEQVLSLARVVKCIQ